MKNEKCNLVLDGNSGRFICGNTAKYEVKYPSNGSYGSIIENKYCKSCYNMYIYDNCCDNDSFSVKKI